MIPAPFLVATTLACLLMVGCAHRPQTPPLVFATQESEREAKALEERLAADPYDSETRLALSRICLAEGFIERTVALLEEGVQLDSRSVEVRLLLASVLQRTPAPDWTRIRRILEQATRIDPELGDAHLYLGQALAQQKINDAALRELGLAEANSKDPAICVAAYLEMVGILQEKGAKDEADAYLQKAKAIFPGVEELLKEAEIRKACPSPQYAGPAGYTGDTTTHPQLEKRVQLLREQIERGRGNPL